MAPGHPKARGTLKLACLLAWGTGLLRIAPPVFKIDRGCSQSHRAPSTLPLPPSLASPALSPLVLSCFCLLCLLCPLPAVCSALLYVLLSGQRFYQAVYPRAVDPEGALPFGPASSAAGPAGGGGPTKRAAPMEWESGHRPDDEIMDMAGKQVIGAITIAGSLKLLHGLQSAGPMMRSCRPTVVLTAPHCVHCAAQVAEFKRLFPVKLNQEAATRRKIS